LKFKENNEFISTLSQNDKSEKINNSIMEIKKNLNNFEEIICAKLDSNKNIYSSINTELNQVSSNTSHEKISEIIKTLNNTMFDEIDSKQSLLLLNSKNMLCDLKQNFELNTSIHTIAKGIKNVTDDGLD